ncbi:MAG: hypothetical protein ACREA0_06100, partial [bacterium]
MAIVLVDGPEGTERDERMWQIDPHARWGQFQCRLDHDAPSCECRFCIKASEEFEEGLQGAGSAKVDLVFAEACVDAGTKDCGHSSGSCRQERDH